VVILDKGRVVLAGQLSELRAAAPRRRLEVTLASDAGDRWWERWSPALSTVVLVACAVAGIAIPAALLGHPQRFTVAVTEQAPPGVAAMARADAKAAGLQLTVQPVASRAAAVRLVEQGKAAAAVAAGGETIWKTHPNSALQPALNAAIQQATITQRTPTPSAPGGSSSERSA
jgi:hypothetical protein